MNCFYDCALLQIVPGEFWNDALWGTLLSCIFNPHSLGFNMADIEVVTKLPEEVNMISVALYAELYSVYLLH